MSTYTGQRFGDYRLIRSLGEGTYGDVYYAEHLYQKLPAAVKVFRIRLTPEKFKTFINEVRTVLLRHPHIIPILDFGIREDDIGYLVMDYAPHGTLRSLHPRGRIVPLPTVAEYVKQAAQALQYAHDHRCIHRDVKPENMLLGANNELVLSDFGISAVAHSAYSQRTEEAIGTALYMAPEQWQGKPVPATDQYALAIIIYEWLCGECPFGGNTLQLMYHHLQAPPPPLQSKVPTISPHVEQVIMKALAKDPGQRFESVQAFASAFEQACLSTLPAVRTTLSTYRGHSKTVIPVAWSPDGTRIASGSEDGTVQVWDAADGGHVSTYRGHSKTVRAVVWSPGGMRIASGDYETVQVWDATTGGNVFTYRGHRVGWLQWGTVAAWSPDGTRIASGSTDKTVQVWDATTGGHVFTYRGHADNVQAVAWSPDGTRIASGSSDKTVQVWTAE